MRTARTRGHANLLGPAGQQHPAQRGGVEVADGSGRYMPGPGIQDDDETVREQVMASLGLVIGRTSQYLGLTVPEARRLALEEGRRLTVCDDSSFYFRRASLRPLHVNVLVGPDDTVVVADAG